MNLKLLLNYILNLRIICIIASSDTYKGSCPRYTDEEKDLNQEKCRIENKNDPNHLIIIHLKPCKNHSDYCNLTTGECEPRSNDNGKNNSYLKHKIKRLPGQTCDLNSDCLSDYCKNITSKKRLCIGRLIDFFCEDHYDCDVGLRCTGNNICDEQIPSNSTGCKDDFDCVNQAGCLNKRCQDYFSLVNGSNTTNRLFCKSGYIFNRKCYEGPKIKNKTAPYECFINDTHLEKCVYDLPNGGILKIDCQCGVNNKGKGFCPLTPTDNKFKNLIELSFNYMANECHTLARNDPDQCYQLKNDSIKKYNKLKHEAYNVQYHSKLIDNLIYMKETELYEIYHFAVNDSYRLNYFKWNLLFLILLIFIY